MGITSCAEGSRVSASGSKSKMADAVDRLVDTEAEVNALVDRLIDTKKEVIRTIEQVDNPTWYNILHMRYIQYITLQGIADHYGKDYEWAKANIRKARDVVQRIREKEEGER